MSEKLTLEQIELGERLEREATPGEWKVQRRWSNECEIVPRITSTPDEHRGCGLIAEAYGAPYLGYDTTLPNFDLIAFARNHLAQLLSAARRELEREQHLAALEAELRRDAVDMESRVGRELSATYVTAKLDAADRIKQIRGQE